MECRRGAARLRKRLRPLRDSPHAHLRASDWPGLQRVPYALPGADSHGPSVQAQRLRFPEKRVTRGKNPRGAAELVAESGCASVLDGANVVYEHEESATGHAERHCAFPGPAEHLHG